jgi:hypothetical protein
MFLIVISKTSVPSVRLSRGHAAQCEGQAPPNAVDAMQQSPVLLSTSAARATKLEQAV